MQHELIPGISVTALAPAERTTVGALRLIAAGRGECPMLQRAFEGLLGTRGETCVRGLETLAGRLPAESGRKLTLGWLCVRGLTWDEAAILALIEAAQRSDAGDIAKWIRRLGVAAPSHALQRGLAWTAAAFSVADHMFDPEVAVLTRANVSRVSQLRDQIETQIGPRD